MAVDIVDLARFYETALGAHVSARLTREMAAAWTKADARDAVLAYGYGVPVAADLWPEADWRFLMPSQQGALSKKNMSQEAPGPTILTHENAWPVRDDSINRMLVMHALEAANQPEKTVQEIYRVLVPNGRAMMIVPNRRGFWARSERTPFGTGRPYSAGQLRQLLRQNGLLPGRLRPVLLAPPGLSFLMPHYLRPASRLAAAIVPHIAGVWMMEAIKQVPAPLSVKRAMSRRKMAAVRPAVISPTNVKKLSR